jgi:hypothetical protein
MDVSTIAHDEQLRLSIGVDAHLAMAKDSRGRTIDRTETAALRRAAPRSACWPIHPPNTSPSLKSEGRFSKGGLASALLTTFRLAFPSPMPSPQA